MTISTPMGQAQDPIQQVKSLRLEIDKLMNTSKSLTPSREVSLAYTALQRGKMWLGKLLGEMGTPNPYPKSSDPSSPVIEQQADHTPDGYLMPVQYGQTERVKVMRDYLAIPITQVFHLDVNKG